MGCASERPSTSWSAGLFHPREPGIPTDGNLTRERTQGARRKLFGRLMPQVECLPREHSLDAFKPESRTSFIRGVQDVQFCYLGRQGYGR